MQTALKYLGALSGCAALVATIAFAAEPAAKPKQDKYTVKVPGGLAFSEFKGYESWQVVSVSHNQKAIAVILGNPAMIKAYEAGIPANGKPVPDGAKMAKVHWVPKTEPVLPGCDGAGRPARRGLHGEGQQAVRRRRRMGLWRVQVRRRDRYVHARHDGRPAAAGERRQVRRRVPHDREGQTITSSRSMGIADGESEYRSGLAAHAARSALSDPGRRGTLWRR